MNELLQRVNENNQTIEELLETIKTSNMINYILFGVVFILLVVILIMSFRKGKQ
jgi:uncharacterized phage infection (PIP) family protein YhgE